MNRLLKLSGGVSVRFFEGKLLVLGIRPSHSPARHPPGGWSARPKRWPFSL